MLTRTFKLQSLVRFGEQVIGSHETYPLASNCQKPLTLIKINNINDFFFIFPAFVSINRYKDKHSGTANCPLRVAIIIKRIKLSVEGGHAHKLALVFMNCGALD